MDGLAYELKINNRTYEVLPHQAKHKERPPLDGADADIKKEFGTCPLCDNEKNYDGRGPVLRLLRRPDLREVRRFIGSASVIQEEVPVVWQRRRGAVSRLVDRGPRGGLSQKSKKGDARAHFSLAAMEAVLSEEEQARHLLLLVDEGFAEAQYIYGSACIDHGFVSDGLRWWILAEQRGHAPASLRIKS